MNSPHPLARCNMVLVQARGFSYVQLLLVVTLLAVIAAVSSPYLLAWQQRERVRTTATILWSDLHYAQSRAMQLEHDEPWGMHIDNSAHQYVIFRGASYSASDLYNETISYSDSISITPSTDIAFAGLTGASSADVSLTIAANNSTITSKTISIYASGLIEQN